LEAKFHCIGLLNQGLARVFFDRLKHTTDWTRLTSGDEHFSVDGTLIDAWASHKSFRRKTMTGLPPKGHGPRGGL
jgi:hypothetical protein